jgi:glyoxylate/hydroxypyruvate reductase
VIRPARQRTQHGLHIVVILLPLTPETRGMIDESVLGALPRGTKLVNAARGELVDEAALLDALRDGHIAEATLDAFATEPLPSDHPFWGMEQVLITPHLASIAIPRTAARQIADNIRRVRDGRSPVNLVDTSRGY